MVNEALRVWQFLDEAQEIITAAISCLDEDGKRPFHDTRTYVNMSAALMMSLVLERIGMTEADFGRAIERYDEGDHKSHDCDACCKERE